MIPDSTDTKSPQLYRELFLDQATALAATLLAFAVYYWTLAPTVTGEDSGELVAAAYTLGIPHPPGYPLWCLLAKAFIELVPYGEVAWRAALLSAVFASLTVYLVSLIIVDLTRSRWAAFAAPIALAYSREFWEQSVIAEVYTLNAFFTALCIYLLLRWSRTYDRPLLWMFALAYGLSLTNHNTMILLFPIFMAFILLIDFRPLRQKRQYLIMSGLCLTGLSVYLYLPIRSLANPPMDWGNPDSWRGFRDVIFRGQYRHLITNQPHSLARFLEQSLVFTKQYAREFTPWIGILALLGIIPLWRNARSTCLLLLSMFAVVVIGAIVIPNFNLDHHWIWMNSPFWIPAYLIAAIFLGVTIATLSQVDSIPRAVVPLLSIAVVLSPLIANFGHNDRREAYFARDYAENLLKTMAPNAVYYGTGDHTIFPLLYLQIVEGLRPDVTIVNKYGYPEAKLYAEMPDVLKKDFAHTPTREDTDRVFAWLSSDSNRPLYSTIRRPADGRKATNAGLLYRYVHDDETIAPEDPWGLYSWHTLDEADIRGDWSAALVLYEYHFARARMYFGDGEPGQATGSMLAAESLVHGDKHALNNLGTLAAENAEYQSARSFFTKALDSDSTFTLARINRGRAYLKLGMPDAALRDAEELLLLDPDSAHARSLKEKSLRDANVSQ